MPPRSTTRSTTRPTQPWPVRLTHWLNAVALVCLAGSGLAILAAFPNFGPRGEPAGWYPFANRPPPAIFQLGGWLAGARHIHFAVAWLFVLNALAYLGWLFASSEWKRRLFSPRRDAREVVRSVNAYAHLREPPATSGPYNGLQRLAYSSALLLGLLSLASGLSLYKPVQLSPLCALFGGYDGARAIHFLTLLGLAAFTLGHVIMVLLHPRELVLMTAGGTRKESP